MLVLGFDTTALACSVALVNADTQQVLSDIQINRGSKHSEQLLPVIDQVLRNARRTISEVELFAVAKGPGSFTGVRIAVATAKALAQGQEAPLIGVNSLEALASNCLCPHSLIVPLLDARKNECYTASFRNEGQALVRQTDDYAAEPQALFTSMQAESSVIFIGEPTERYRQQIHDALGDKAVIAPSAMGSIRGAQVAALGWKQYNQGQRDSFFDLAPLYLRKSEAETTWEAKHGG